jgi:uncharacterized protein
MMKEMQVYHARERGVRRWKNGRGSTAEIAVYPEQADLDGFEWRISIAEVSERAPFSIFNGVDRTLILLDGMLDLVIANCASTVRLGAGDVVSFPGDVASEGIPISRSARDLNVMVRRGCWMCSVAAVDPEEGAAISPALGSTLFLIATGATLLSAKDQELRLDRDDAVLVPAGSCWISIGEGILQAVTLTKVL